MLVVRKAGLDAGRKMNRGVARKVSREVDGHVSGDLNRIPEKPRSEVKANLLGRLSQLFELDGLRNEDRVGSGISGG